MPTRLEENLNGDTANYIFPFFWQHGEPEPVLRKYMEAIHKANIGAVCVEARPHPDFGGVGWWKDMDVILDEARKRNMKIWILDDAHFPTGTAGGLMEKAPNHLKKQFLFYNTADIVGSCEQIRLNAEAMAKYRYNPFEAEPDILGTQNQNCTDDELYAVIACEMSANVEELPEHLEENAIDLTSNVLGGQLVWNVPEGIWRIFVIYKTRNGGGSAGYINMLSFPSCEMQIKGIYEPHFNRYKDDFGKTIAGFFSDEPAVGNSANFKNDNKLGKKNMQIPWSDEMESVWEKTIGNKARLVLPALWFPMGDPAFTADIRVRFMDCMTKLIQKDFGEQIGNWCRSHGVEYIGHIVEDNNMHTRLGNSQGHYFRALWGQDMAGIDVICRQVMAGGDNAAHRGIFLEEDGEFYHNALGKMGSSLGHLDPKKRGRTMCEIFGAYGWETGTRTMKYLADHFLVRGINRFVPHAFSPKEFPDADCPPHFYAHGKNPLYRPFGELMAYMNRMCHLLDGGVHRAKVALLYHAEADWSGTDFMYMQKPARVLLENQIDFDIIPADVFSDAKAYQTEFNGTLRIGKEEFEALIIGESSYIPDCVREFIHKSSKMDFLVVYVGKHAPEGMDHMTVCSLAELPAVLRKNGIYDITLYSEFKNLRYYHYERADEIYYLLTNESVKESFDDYILFPCNGTPYCYQAMENKVYRTKYKQNKNGTEVWIRLRPYEACVVVFPLKPAGYEEEAISRMTCSREKIIEPNWKVSFSEEVENPTFKDSVEMTELKNMLEIKPNFSGIIAYEAVFDIENIRTCMLEFDNIYEAADVWINGEYAGMKFSPTYEFDISGLVQNGKNSIRIEVMTTLERRVSAITDETQANIIFPSGLLGSMRIKY